MSSLIKWLENASIKTSVSVLVVIIALLGGGSVYNTYVNRTETVTIAGKLGSEPEILINMYKELIEQDDEHIKVTLKPNFGKTTFLYNALKNDQIDIYPEFSGTVLETLAKRPQQTSGLTANETYKKARKIMRQQDDIELLRPMKYNNSYALAVQDKFKKEHHLQKISDLNNVQSILNGGMTLEFIDRGDGLKGIKQKYGLDFPVKSMEPALRYQAINKDRINIVDAYSTDSELRQYHLSILKDDKHMFPTYQGAPMMTKDFVKKHPQISKSLNKLAGKITEKEMQEMNYEVNVQDKAPAAVAHQYLVSHHLLKEDD